LVVAVSEAAVASSDELDRAHVLSFLAGCTRRNDTAVQ